MTLALLVWFLLSPPLPSGPGGKGVDYLAPDLKYPSPGSDWQLQTIVPGAPQLRGAFTLSHGAAGDSLITFAIDKNPAQSDPLEYMEKGFEQLTRPPILFKITRKGADKVKGLPAARMEYTDRDGKRQFREEVARAPDGSMLVTVLQAPDQDSFQADVHDFERGLAGIDLSAKKAP
jgi:hypothetical protein